MSVDFLSPKFTNFELTAYDGDGDGDGTQTPPAPPVPGQTGPDGKLFTQDDLNKFLAEDRRKHQQKIEKLETDLQGALQNAQLTAEERSSLESSLSDLRKQFRSKEQEAEEQKRKIENEFQDRVKRLEQEKSEWQKRYTESTIQRALTDAANKHGAYNTDQIISQLWNSTRMVEIVGDDGKPTGVSEPMVDLFEINPDSGERVTTQRTPEDALKRMSELPQYANLFKSNVASGLSAASATGRLKPGSNGQVDVKKLTHEEYMKIRKTNPELLGLR